MSTVFISHSSRDKLAATKIKCWLERHEHHSIFLDFDPDAGIAAGARWETTLFEKLGRCQALIALVSNHWLASKWCFAEFVQAREHGKLIILAMIAPDTMQPFSDLQHIDVSRDDPDEYRKLELALSTVHDWDPSRPPYPGLLAFQEKDAAIFFGRDAEIDQAQQCLERMRLHRNSGSRCLLMLGASGSGKSSIVRAGVIPRLRRLPESWLVAAPFQPREKPMTELALVLSQDQPEHSWREIRELLERGSVGRAADGTVLGNLVRTRLARAGHPDATMLLVIDQAEELLVPRKDSVTDQFLGLLRRALDDADGRLMVLATMRSDFLGVFQTHPFLTAHDYHDTFHYSQITVDPLPAHSLKEIITGPARRSGVRLQNGLVERLVGDTHTGDALPLLAYTLRRLWDTRELHDTNCLTVHAYERLGGLAGAIEIAADEALDVEHQSSKAIDAVRSAFVPGLVRVNAEGTRVRRIANREELPPQADVLIARFIDARLLISDRDEAGAETVAVAHEALLRTWRRLKLWINQDQDTLRALEALDRAAAEWRWLGRPGDLLIHREGRLNDLLVTAGDPRFAPVISPEAHDYLRHCKRAQQSREQKAQDEKSRRARDAERIVRGQQEKIKAQRQTVRRTRVLASIVIVIAVVAVAAALYAVRAREAASEQRNLAVAQQLAAQAELLIQTGSDVEAQLGAMLALESIRRAPKALLSQRALAKSVSYFPLLVREIAFKKVEPYNHVPPPLAISADGRFFAASGPDEATRVWSVKDGKLVHRITHADTVLAIEFDNSGEHLAMAGLGESIDLWRTSDGELDQTIETTGRVQTLAFSSRGDLLAAAPASDTSNMVNVFNTHSGELQRSIDHRSGDVVAMDFGPRDQFLATAGWHHSIGENVTQIWDLETGDSGQTDNHLDSNSVAYSHNGMLVAAGGFDHRVQVWATTVNESADMRPLSYAVLAELEVEGVRSFAFSPDDSLLAIAGKELVLWEFRSGRKMADFKAHDLIKVAFVEHGRFLVGANNTTMTLWNLERGAKLERYLQTQRGPVLGEEVLKLSAALCARVAGTITDEEWSRYVPNEPPPPPCVTDIEHGL